MADETDRAIKTVKNIDPTAWDKGLQAAKKRGEPFGVWLARAIARQADVEADDRVILPDERASLPDLAPGLPERDSMEVAAMLFAGLGQVAGVKGCGGIAARARAVLDQHLAGLALAPIERRKDRQTQPKIGQTPPELHAVSSTAA